MSANHPAIPRYRLRAQAEWSRAILGVVVLMVLSIGALQGEDLTNADLVFPARRVDIKPWRQQFYEYNLHTIGDIFRKNYDHGQPWAASAAHVLDDLAACFAEIPGAISTPALKAEAVAVVGLGCEDPMVLYACGIGYQISRQTDQAIEMYARAFARYQVTVYPAARTFSCLGRMLQCRLMKEGKYVSRETEAVAQEWISYGVKALIEVNAGDAVGRENYSKDFGEGSHGTYEMRERLHKAMIAEIDKGGVNPWFGDVITGYAEIDRAWAARGGGWADSVTPEGWKGFAQHLDLAEKELSAAWATDQTLAQAPAGMIKVCMGKDLGFAAQKMWMNRALSAQMDFMDPYWSLFNAWLPRWGGNHEAILAVGRQALATKAFNTWVPEALLLACDQVANDLQSTNDDPNLVWRNAQVWNDIQALFEGDLTEPSRAAVRDWDLTRYAAFAWKCGKKEQTLKILKRLKGQADALIFEDIAHESLDTAQKIAAPAEPPGPAPSGAAEAEQLVAAGKQAMQDSNADPSRSVAAAVFFSKAITYYEAAGDVDKASDLQANIFWCKKRMNVDDVKSFMAQKSGDKSVTEALAKADEVATREIPKTEAKNYFDRAEKYAKDHPEDYEQIAVHYFEVAERFVGTDISLQAQKLSLAAQQQMLSQVRVDKMAERKTLFTHASGAMDSAEEKASVPSPEKLRSALAELHKIYKDDYARNRQPNQKRVLTAKLLDLGISTKDDPVFRYALLTEVVDLASTASDWYSVITAIDQMSEHFTGVDPLVRKKEAIGRFHANPTAAAVLKLLDNPEDADANTLIGRSLCLEWGNWEAGCPLLARGNDADFKVAAEMEVARPSLPSEQLELGDKWYALGRKSRPGVKEVVLARANVWYRHVQPSLTGITKDRIAQRSEEIAAVVAKVDGAAAMGGTIIIDLTAPPWAAARGKDQFGAWADLTVAGVTQRLRLIKPGTFLMGSPPSESDRAPDELLHKVTLTKPCWMADSPCTQAFWTAVMGMNPSHFHGDQLPVESVSWDDCMRFIRTLDGKIPLLGARMPTEAEWEYACRGGVAAAYAGGSLEEMAWISRNANNSTHDVRQKKPNPWGLFDMHGNVWEPCSDVYGSYDDGPLIDPVGSHVGDNHVIRGGGWDLAKEYGRSARRGQNAPGNFGNYQGLRICVSSPAP